MTSRRRAPAGHRDVVAPPTFCVTFTMPLIEAFLRDPAFGWDYARMVHGDQSITLHRPVFGGDELVTTIHVEDLATRAGSHMLTLRCAVADPRRAGGHHQGDVGDAGMSRHHPADALFPAEAA